MKPVLFRFAVTALALAATMSAHCDNLINGVRYAFRSNGTAAVVRRGWDPASFLALEGKVVIPEYVTYEGRDYLVTEISDGAFENCSLVTDFEFPMSIGLVAANAFSGTYWLEYHTDGLIYVGAVAYRYIGSMPEETNIALREGTRTIAQSAFKNCSKLKSIDVGQTEYIYREAFSGCTGLSGITLGDRLVTISDYAFKDCRSLRDITIPQTTVTIGSYAFDNCGMLEKITIPNSLKTIGLKAFNGCDNLNKVCITDLVAWCGINFVKNNDDLISEALSNPLLAAHHLYLNGNKVVGLKLPDTVTSISERAFLGCSSLETLTFQGNAPHIGVDAFAGCSGLKAIYVPWQRPPRVKSIFTGVDKSNCILYVPEGSETAYWAMDVWNEFARIEPWNPDGAPASKYDLNGDGMVDVNDISRLINVVLGK